MMNVRRSNSLSPETRACSETAPRKNNRQKSLFVSEETFHQKLNGALAEIVACIAVVLLLRSALRAASTPSCVVLLARPTAVNPLVLQTKFVVSSASSSEARA